MRLIYLLLIVLSFGLISCNRAIPDLFPANEEERDIAVYMISHGWHVGLAVPVDSTFRRIIPESVHAHNRNWAELGWGDRDYYTQKSKGFWGILKGAFWPTRSVVHIAAFDRDPPAQFSRLDQIEIKLTPEGYEHLLKFLKRTLKRDEYGQVTELMDGLYADARFYPSDRRYFLPRTSNTWTVRLLREAGAPVNPVWAVTSRNAMRQARGIGTVVE